MLTYKGLQAPEAKRLVRYILEHRERLEALLETYFEVAHIFHDPHVCYEGRGHLGCRFTNPQGQEIGLGDYQQAEADETRAAMKELVGQAILPSHPYWEMTFSLGSYHEVANLLEEFEDVR